jgi:RNA polymerase sigma factor (sigma-70 family)
LATKAKVAADESSVKHHAVNAPNRESNEPFRALNANAAAHCETIARRACSADCSSHPCDTWGPTVRSPLRRTNAARNSPLSLSASHHISDEELLARLRSDDTNALELALRNHWTLVVDYITRLTGSEDSAEDVAQRAFCQLWDRRAQWRATGSVRALLCRIARNYAVSEHRRQSADERSAETFVELTQPMPPWRDRIETEQLRSALDREIALLPERRREILVLRCMHDLSYKEIADVMNIAQQTVANQLSSALATLRVSLRDLLD